MNLTVIPQDRLIIKNAQSLSIDFNVDDAVHAVQWNKDKGWIEFNDGRPNKILKKKDFEKHIKIFSDIYDAEQQRLESCPGPAYKWDGNGWVYVEENDIPEAGCKLIDGQWRKLIFAKKDFMVFCGVPIMSSLNKAIDEGQCVVKTVYDFLMAADYIDLEDCNTVAMIKLLASDEAGKILDGTELERLLSGQAM